MTPLTAERRARVVAAVRERHDVETELARVLEEHLETLVEVPVRTLRARRRRSEMHQRERVR